MWKVFWWFEVSCNAGNSTTTYCALFKALTCLYSHKKIYRDRVYHQCNHCQVQYIQNTQLRKPMDAIHLKQKDHICSICGKCYSKDTTLSKHQNDGVAGVTTEAGEDDVSFSLSFLFTFLLNILFFSPEFQRRSGWWNARRWWSWREFPLSCLIFNVTLFSLSLFYFR